MEASELTPSAIEGMPVEEGADTSSLLGRIKEQREERLKDESLTLPIPTWGGDLLARYRVMDRKEMMSLARRVREIQRKTGNADAATGDTDFILKACECVLVKDPESGEIKELDDPQTGMLVGYDQRLAQALGLEVEKARDVLLHLFNNNAVAIGAHALKIARWMQDTSREVDDEVLGE